MVFKERLVSLRKEKNLSQEQFAKQIGFSRTAVSAWEIGRNEPSHEQTIKLANFFNVSTDYLLGNTDIRNTEKDLFISAYDSDKIDDRDKELLLNLYNNMIKNKKKE